MSLLFVVLPVVQKVISAGSAPSKMLCGAGLLWISSSVSAEGCTYSTSGRLDPVWCGLFAVMQIGLSLFGEIGADNWAGCWGTWLACGDVVCSRQLGWVWSDGIVTNLNTSSFSGKHKFLIHPNSQESWKVTKGFFLLDEGGQAEKEFEDEVEAIGQAEKKFEDEVEAIGRVGNKIYV
ncbi:hypothetical protein E3N88_07414 [Mikania micrantha]|uniref:Uncharacterized protein n=1 Tax=Mikania micrantha TaxID=192012 RepID=A0A5N6PRI9_9ASTR|nr:hypothetical protein E3N88_07414 [Mikania micrantha]